MDEKFTLRYFSDKLVDKVSSDKIINDYEINFILRLLNYNFIDFDSCLEFTFDSYFYQKECTEYKLIVIIKYMIIFIANPMLSY